MIGKEGWKLVGDKNAIVIEKNGHQVAVTTQSKQAVNPPRKLI
jgi:hypothetical protein